MRKNKYEIVSLLVIVFICSATLYAQEYSGNPIVKSIHTADPCAIVYKDSLYLFTGHDEQTGSGEFFVMRDWRIFSTADMVNWTDHGVRLTPASFSWASGNAFAGHVVENNGKFWWYVPMTHKTIKVNEGFAIGVAVADHPLGPYRDAMGGKALITDQTPNSIALNIDPAVYIDNGTPYLFWGSWGASRRVKLKTNMIELDGPVETVNLRNFFEAPWIHKRNNLYYFSYAASGFPSTIEYATSTSINGPWNYVGVLNDRIPNCSTNHQAIVQFKGNWYFIYHDAGLPNGGTYRRSVCIDKLEYNSDGTLKKIVRTTTGVPKINTVSYTVKTTAGPGGVIQQNPAGSSLAENASVTFTAVPHGGWVFSGWSGDYSGTNSSYTVPSLKSNVNLTAAFTFIATDSSNYEAENTTMYKSVSESTNSGFSGTGYANFDNEIGSSIEFAVCVSESGEKSVEIAFANGSTAARRVSVAVNGTEVYNAVNFDVTGSWTTWDVKNVQLALVKGVNTVKFTSATSDGGPNIDKIRLIKPTSIVGKQKSKMYKGEVKFNPQSSVIQIKNVGSGVKVELYSINGQRMMSRYSNGGTADVLELSTHSLKSGQYLLKMESNGWSGVSKVNLIK